MDRISNGFREARKLAAGYVPTEADLADAPIIDRWRPIRLGDMPALVGEVTGHPTIPDGHPVVTRAVLSVNLEGGWARTVSRYYRLGRQLGEAPQ